MGPMVAHHSLLTPGTDRLQRKFFKELRSELYNSRQEFTGTGQTVSEAGGKPLMQRIRDRRGVWLSGFDVR